MFQLIEVSSQRCIMFFLSFFWMVFWFLSIQDFSFCKTTACWCSTGVLSIILAGLCLLWNSFFFFLSCSSVKHEYEGEWNDEKTRLTTCDPHAKRTVVNSDSPQEVEDKKEIVFTYDVEFEVRLLKPRFLVEPSSNVIVTVFFF